MMHEAPQFPWQALATFVTGLMAVCGAVIIALRQMGITRRQADIAERQAGIQERQVGIQERQAGIQERQTEIQHAQFRLQERNLDIQLFKDRMDVYEAMSIFLAEAASTGRLPSAEATRRFVHAIGKARFLFRPEIHAGLSEVWVKVESLEKLGSDNESKGAEYDETKRWIMERLPVIGKEFQAEMTLVMEASSQNHGGLDN